MFSDDILRDLTKTYNVATYGILQKIYELKQNGEHDPHLKDIASYFDMNQHRFAQEMIRLEVSCAIEIYPSILQGNAKMVSITDNGIRILQLKGLI